MMMMMGMKRKRRVELYHNFRHCIAWGWGGVGWRGRGSGCLSKKKWKLKEVIYCPEKNIKQKRISYKPFLMRRARINSRLSPLITSDDNEKVGAKSRRRERKVRSTSGSARKDAKRYWNRREDEEELGNLEPLQRSGGGTKTKIMCGRKRNSRWRTKNKSRRKIWWSIICISNSKATRDTKRKATWSLQWRPLEVTDDDAQWCTALTIRRQQEESQPSRVTYSLSIYSPHLSSL